MDRVNEKAESLPPKLPEGLRGIGMGLGEGGRALQDVSRKLPYLFQLLYQYCNNVFSYVCLGSLPANLQNAQLQMGMAALQNTGMPNIHNQALGGNYFSLPIDY
jgi:hypothetical protein